MTTFDYDFFVIGAGSGGVRASRMAAGFGARVAVAEPARLGGTCVNVGCVPKKLMVYASQFRDHFSDAAGFGWTVPEATHDFGALMRAKDAEITRLNGIYQGLLERAGVTVLRGRARFLDPHTLDVGGQRITAQHILVATGGVPYVPPGPGAELLSTSDDVFALSELPERVLIVGGGFIAVEFAGIFHGLGSRVELVHRGPRVLRGFDDDVQKLVTQQLAERGIQLHLEQEVVRTERAERGLRATLTSGSECEADFILCAAGRKPNTQGLNLEAAAVAVDEKGAIQVDAYSRTNVPHIYAVGDVTDRINLTPVAIAEGSAVAQTLFNEHPTRPDHRDVPSAVFCQPNVGAVGLTEQEAREEGHPLKIFRSTFRPLKHTLGGRHEKTMMKLVVHAETDRVLGVHVVGDEAGEIVQGFAVAVKMGATKAQLNQTIGIHPTAAEELVTMRTPV